MNIMKVFHCKFHCCYMWFQPKYTKINAYSSV